MLRDIRRAEADVLAQRDAVIAARPDILLLLDFDYDLDGLALSGFADLLAEAGHPMPHRFAAPPNTGLATALDLDGDGRRGGPGDAQGWGRFAGSGGMALLSRFPLETGRIRDHTAMLWRDLPGARLPQFPDGAPFPSAQTQAIQRLASVAAWEMPVLTPDGALLLLAWHATPPAFDGPEGRNRQRNADEVAFWRLRLNGALGPPPQAPLVLIGNANLDPEAGNGARDEIRALLNHPALQDPQPIGIGPDGTASPATASWPDDGPGTLRVDYLLPSAGLRALEAGMIWPSDAATHALVWTDIAWPP